MKAIVVIPARYGSTRFPGKPLALLFGRSLIEWTYKASLKSLLADSVLVATDDIRIANEVKGFGGGCVLTASDLPSGSDRVYSAVKNLDCEIVVNVQGDEPLTSAESIDSLIGALRDNPDVSMATLSRPLKPEELCSQNAVKVVLNSQSDAIYFSRFPIPYSRNPWEEGKPLIPRKHIGLYAYRKSFLKAFCETEPSPLELFESLEQLRALSLGARIRVLNVEEEALGVDTPEDMALVEKYLREKGGLGEG